MEEIYLEDILVIIKKKKGFIILLSLAGLLLVALYSFFIVTPKYESTTQLLVNQRLEKSVGIQLNDINTNVSMIDTYKDIIKGPVIDEVKNKLNINITPEEFRNMINITANANSQVFSLTINSKNPIEAAEIANEIATTFQSEISEILNVESVTIISKATVQTISVSPNIPLNLIIGLLVGLMVGVGIAFLQSYLDNTIKGSKFVTESFGWPDLGTISTFSNEDIKEIKQYTGNDVKTSRRSRVK